MISDCPSPSRGDVEIGDFSGLPIVAFVGHSGSGKTTLLLKVIPLLRAHGIRVVVIKHSSHRGIETDVPGSDTRRLWDAGAAQVALVAPDRMTVSRRFDAEPSLDTVVASLAAGSASLSPNPRVRGASEEVPRNVVIVEGYKRSQVPKIEVIRAACCRAPLPDLEHRLACVTDVRGLDLDCPVFDLEDAVGVADFLITHIGSAP